MSTTSTPTASDESHDAAHTQSTKADEPELRLLLAFAALQSSSETLEVSARPVMVKQEPDGRLEVRNLESIGFDTHPLADMLIRALADRADAGGETHLWSVEYRHCYAVDLRRVEMMHTTLKRVHRALEKVARELGPPETFPAYLARCAAALRITSFGFHAGACSGWHDRNEYQWTDATGMVYRITDHLARWRSKDA